MSLLRGCALVVAALALAPAPLSAQTPAPAGAGAAAPQTSSPPDTVPVGEISARARSVADEVRSLESALTQGTDRASLREDLERLGEGLDAHAQEVGRRLAEGPSLRDLSDLRDEWSRLERQIDTREERLSRLVETLEQQAQSLRDAGELWRRTRLRERERSTPQPILELAKGAEDDLARGTGAVKQALQEALGLQNQFAALHAKVRDALWSIDAARERVLEHLLARDHPPLWQVNLLAELHQANRWLSGSFAAELRERSGPYLAQHPESVALHVLLFGLLAWALRGARRALRRVEPGAAVDSGLSGALLATQHPVAAAAVLALVATPLVYEELPRQLGGLTRLVVALPLFLVLRPLLGEALRAPLYVLTVFFVTDRVRELLTGAMAPDRLLLIAEMLVLAGMLAALLGRRRLERMPASARGNRWLAALGLWIRFSIAASLVAALASVAGYTRLARLLAGGVLGSGYAALAGYALLRIGEGLAAAILGGGGAGRSRLRMLERHRALMLARTSRALQVAILILWVLAVARLFALGDPLFRALGALLATPIGFGNFAFTLGGVVAFAVTLLAAWLFARAVSFVLDEELFPRLSLARGVPFALGTLARYAILLIGFLVALSTLGFDLDRITILLGAFGVGIGFGLQTVVNNFISGLILLFERPVKVGDSVELAGVEGTVQRIGIRASTVRTYDGADVIVPNGQLLSERVVNWTLSDRRRRVVVAVGVAYGSDLTRVMEVLRSVAEGVSGVGAYPKPVVAFMGFGESSIDFQLRVWIDDADMLIETRSALGLAIDAALRQARIEIPFPQRVLHVGSVAPQAAAALRDAPQR